MELFMPLSITLLAFSAPITAAIIQRVPKKTNGADSNGKYVTVREFDSFKEMLMSRLSNIENGIRDLCDRD